MQELMKDKKRNEKKLGAIEKKTWEVEEMNVWIEEKFNDQVGDWCVNVLVHIGDACDNPQKCEALERECHRWKSVCEKSVNAKDVKSSLVQVREMCRDAKRHCAASADDWGLLLELWTGDDPDNKAEHDWHPHLKTAKSQVKLGGLGLFAARHFKEKALVGFCGSPVVCEHHTVHEEPKAVDLERKGVVTRNMAFTGMGHDAIHRTWEPHSIKKDESNHPLCMGIHCCNNTEEAWKGEKNKLEAKCKCDNCFFSSKMCFMTRKRVPVGAEFFCMHNANDEVSKEQMGRRRKHQNEKDSNGSHSN